MSACFFLLLCHAEECSVLGPFITGTEVPPDILLRLHQLLNDI